jgi:hypothetical protein
MYSRLISTAAGAWILMNPAAALSDTVTLQPKIFPISSFSLITGMAFDGKSIWLADMGAQEAGLVVRLDTNFKIARRIKIDGDAGGSTLASNGNGVTYAANGRTIWRASDADGAVKKLAGLGIDNCPESSIAAGGSFLWILNSCQDKQDKNGSSSSASGALLLRIDPKTGERNVAPLGMVGDAGHQLLVHQGKVWVGGDHCSVVDVDTLAMSTFRPDGMTSVVPSAANAHRIYFIAQASDKGPQFIIAADPTTLKETARMQMDSFIVNVVADDENVVAFGQQQIYVLSASDLSLQRVITPSASVEQFQAEFVLIHNGDLLIADDELGVDIPNRILLFHDWRPPAVPTSAPK